MEGVSLMRMAMTGDYKGLLDKIQQDTEEKLPKVRERLSRWGENIKGVVGRATDWIKNAWSNGWNNISSFSTNIFGRIGESARDKFNSLVEFMRGIPGRIKGVFASAGTWLANAGRAIIDGLVAGIRGAFDRVKSTLNELTSFLPSWKGPPSTDRVILRDAGQMVIQGFVDGLESQYQNARRSLGGFTDSLQPAPLRGVPASPGLNGVDRLVRAMGESAGRPIEVKLVMGRRELASTMVETMAWAGDR